MPNKNGVQHEHSKSHKRQNVLIQNRQLRTFGKTTKINFKERTPKSLYRTEVDNIGWQYIPYIYYSLAKKWALVVVEKCGFLNFIQFVQMAMGGGTMSKGKELVHTDV